MSHDQGLPWARHHSSRPHQRPSLDRPSLFAGMEADEDDAPDRVRILSTLAANRPPSKRASHRRSRARGTRRHSWQFKALLGLMALGIVGLLAGFVMVLSQGRPHSPTERTGEATEAVMHARPAVLPAPMTSTSTAPQTAVIEELSPSPHEDSPGPRSTVAHAPAPQAQASVPHTAPLVAAVSASEEVERPSATVSRPDKAVARSARAETRPASPETKRGHDADVALLEAMFAHTRPARAEGDKRGQCAQHPQANGCAATR